MSFQFINLQTFKKITPWFYLMATVSIWHIWRGALGDAVIFGIPAIILLLDSLGFHPIKLTKRIYFKTEFVLVGAILIWAILSFTPRYNSLVSFIFVLLIFISFISIWSFDLGRRPKSNQAQKRATVVWITLIVLLCLVEFSAYVAATFNGGDDLNYPTITVVLDPVLNHTPQRMVLVALWIALGMKFNRWQVRS